MKPGNLTYYVKVPNPAVFPRDEDFYKNSDVSE